MSQPQTSKYVRAQLIINDIPTTSKKDRINLLTWLENQIESLREDDPRSFGKTHTARLIELE